MPHEWAAGDDSAVIPEGRTMRADARCLARRICVLVLCQSTNVAITLRVMSE